MAEYDTIKHNKIKFLKGQITSKITEVKWKYFKCVGYSSGDEK